jgi:hypothetical protein
MRKKYRVKVIGKDGWFVAYIRRVLNAEVFGNFNPIFCRYKGKRYLVKSEAGDLSDPFRVTEDYFDSLYIEV